jgi:hypothetical protein
MAWPERGENVGGKNVKWVLKSDWGRNERMKEPARGSDATKRERCGAESQAREEARRGCRDIIQAGGNCVS